MMRHLIAVAGMGLALTACSLDQSAQGWDGNRLKYRADREVSCDKYWHDLGFAQGGQIVAIGHLMQYDCYLRLPGKVQPDSRGGAQSQLTIAKALG